MAYFIHRTTGQLVQISQSPDNKRLGVDVVEYAEVDAEETAILFKELFDAEFEPAPYIDQMESDITELVRSTFLTNATTGD